MTYKSAHFLPGTNKRLGNKYLLLECLGDGSHGWVWRAERLKDGQIVAVKIPKQLTKDDRSLSEGRDLMGIEQHPNIIRIHDMGRVPPDLEWFAIEMEYFPSESLAQKLERRAQQFGNTYDRLFNIFNQVLDAVGFLANLPTPISHGDIKPHNILVGSDDLVKLTDFGSSALPEEIYVRTRENGGTILYSAPEYSDCAARRGSFVSLLRGDIYSLGVLLYQLTTGRLPHDTPAQIRSHAPFPKPSEVNSNICLSIDNLILKCLCRNPDDRYESIAELKSAFLEASTAQLIFRVHSTVPADHIKKTDWSVDVTEALEAGNYLKAARLAEAEFRKTDDYSAFFQQINALFRAERWFDFENAFIKFRSRNSQPLDQAALILGVRAFILIRKLDFAKELLEEACLFEKSQDELVLLRASILGMEAKYAESRKLLEHLNQRQPGETQVLRRLVQVCEQLRDYRSAAGYLRACLRALHHDPQLMEKRALYEKMGLW